MSSRSLSLALIAALGCGNFALAQNTASIQGTIVDSKTGKAVAGAIINASKTTTPAARAAATSSFDGTFAIPSLAAGAYDLCVQAPGDGYLATCHWGISATTVTVTAGQQSTGTTLKLTPGSILKIHMDDASQLLSQKTKDGARPDLVMGVWSSGMFYPAHVANKAAAATDYQVTVPLDTSLKFSIQSRRLALGDASKNPLASNADQQAFQHASSAPTPAGYSYSVLAWRP